MFKFTNFMHMTKLLLVEDDPGLGYILKEYLELNDYAVHLAKDGETGMEVFRREDFDLCILDVMLPRKDGFSLAREIRELDRFVPLIFLTAKALKVDKLKGFKIGADDYIVKPVDEEELIARIEAIIKRSRYASVQQLKEIVYPIGQYRFDYSNQSLYFAQTKQMLTTKESEMLKLLCDRQGRLLDRKAALVNLWGESDYFTRRSMDVFISRLRKYLSKDPKVQITNVHGKGYILYC